jgi:hypothetical protein
MLSKHLFLSRRKFSYNTGIILTKRRLVTAWVTACSVLFSHPLECTHKLHFNSVQSGFNSMQGAFCPWRSLWLQPRENIPTFPIPNVIEIYNTIELLIRVINVI